MCFVDLKSIWMICKVSKWFEKCMDNLKSVRMISKVSELSENFPDDLKSVRMIWKECCQSTYYKLWNLPCHVFFIYSWHKFKKYGEIFTVRWFTTSPEIQDLQRLSQVSNTENAYINKIWLRKLRTLTAEIIWPTSFQRRYFFESASPVWYVRSSTATVSRVPLIVYVNRIWRRYWKGKHLWILGLEYTNKTVFSDFGIVSLFLGEISRVLLMCWIFNI